MLCGCNILYLVVHIITTTTATMRDIKGLMFAPRSIYTAKSYAGGEKAVLRFSQRVSDRDAREETSGEDGQPERQGCPDGWSLAQIPPVEERRRVTGAVYCDGSAGISCSPGFAFVFRGGQGR